MDTKELRLIKQLREECDLDKYIRTDIPPSTNISNIAKIKIRHSDSSTTADCFSDIFNYRKLIERCMTITPEAMGGWIIYPKKGHQILSNRYCMLSDIDVISNNMPIDITKEIITNGYKYTHCNECNECEQVLLFNTSCVYVVKHSSPTYELLHGIS